MFKSIKEIFGSKTKSDDWHPDDAYWRRRWEEDLKDKTIVKRYLVCFGVGHYSDFCGIKEITGHYDKTYPPHDSNKSYEENWNKNIDIFYQTDFNEGYSKHGHKVDFCFETKEEAQSAYNENVHLYIDPLQERIDKLNAARSQK